jgi:hypothetical protein
MRRCLLSAAWVLTIVLSTENVEAQKPKQQPADKGKLFEPLQHGEGIDLDRAIPANERGILALAVDPEGRVYGGTTGRAAHLFVYDPAKKDVRSLVRLEGGIGFAYALIRLPDGSLIGGTQADPTGIATATDAKEVGWLYRFTIGKDGKAKVDKLGKPVAGQGIYTLAFDEKTQTVMGNTFPDGHFFTYDLKSAKFTDHGAIAGYRPYETPEHAKELMKGTNKKISYSRQVSRAILLDADANGATAFTGGKDGYIYQFDLKAGKLSKTEFRLPAIAGREPWASLDVVHPTVGLCGTSDGYLFFPTWRHGGAGVPKPFICAGKPSSQGKFHGIVHVGNYKLGGFAEPLVNYSDYVGVVGGAEGMPRTFKLTTNGAQSLVPGKIPQVNGQPSMVGFGAMVKDNKGNIYAGEQDRIARLVRYPTKQLANPIKPPAPPTPPKDLDGPPPEQGLDNKLAGKVTFAPLGTTTDGSGYTALAVGLDGTIYVGSARYGGYARLLQIRPNNQSFFMEQIIDVEDICGEHLVGINTQGKIHAIIIIGPDGRVWFATKQAHEIFDTRPEYGEDPDGYPGGHLCVYDPKTKTARSMGILKKQEGIMCGAMDTKLDKIYYRSEPKNNFLVYDMKTNRVQDRGHMGNFCRYFAMDKDGAVYAPGRGNYLCRYDPKTNYVEDLLIEIDGPGYYSAPYVVEVGPNGKLYGAGTNHPWIMEFDIANYQKGLFPKVKMRNVAPSAPKGMPTNDIHAGVFGKDGQFYYPLNTVGPVKKGGKADAHLRIMRFDPVAGKTETVGIPDTSSLDESKVKHAYVRDVPYKLQYIQGAKVGADGTLYLMAIYPQLNVVEFPKLTAPKK